jgi:diguanylate cyclase (GGDEF)-like protein
MSLATALAYWSIVGIWLIVLCTIAVFYRRNPRGFGSTRLLLLVVAVEAFCNIVQTAYVDGQAGPFSADLVDASGGVFFAMLPKLLNILSGIFVLAILLLRWLPAAVEERRTADAERELAMRDQLTGLANRRYFLIQAEIECDRARRHNRALSLLILDIDFIASSGEPRAEDAGDHFLAGEQLLVLVAKACRDCTRSADIVARLDAREFGILLPETRGADARRFADRLRRATAGVKLEHETGETAAMISVGIAEAAWDTDFPKLMKQADIALDTAKQSGGDRICVFDSPDAWIKQPA